MVLRAEADVITSLWNAIKQPWPSRAIKPGVGEWLTGLASKGWAVAWDMEDLPVTMDGRIDTLHDLHFTQLAELFDLPIPIVYPRQTKSTEEVSGFQCMSAANFAYLLIMLERLGFRMELTTLVEALEPNLKAAAHVTAEERVVRFYKKWRHRMPPVSIDNVSMPPAGGLRVEKLTTALGYRAELYSAESGVPLTLTVSPPRRRNRAEAAADAAKRQRA